MNVISGFTWQSGGDVAINTIELDERVVVHFSRSKTVTLFPTAEKS